MLAIFTCSLFRGLFLVVNKLEVMLHHIGKALWILPGGRHLLFLMAALLPRAHTLSTILQWDGQ